MTEEDLETANDGTETSSLTFEVSVDVTENGYIINQGDFNDLYNSIKIALEGIESNAMIPNITVADLSLDALTPNNATISLFVMTTKPILPAPPYPTPGGEVHAAQKQGWCVTNVGNVDVADFLRGHANTQLGQQLPVQKYVITNSVSTVNVWSKTKFFRTQYPNYANYELPYIWNNYFNECIGDNTDPANNDTIWHQWYNKMHPLVNIPLNFLHNNEDPRYVFTYTDYHSQLNGSLYFPNSLFHEGIFNFQIKI